MGPPKKPRAQGKSVPKSAPVPRDAHPYVPPMTAQERANLMRVLREAQEARPRTSSKDRLPMRPLQPSNTTTSPGKKPVTPDVMHDMRRITSELEPIRRLIELKQKNMPTRSTHTIEELTRKRDQLIAEFNRHARQMGREEITPEAIKRFYQRYLQYFRR